MNEIRGNRRAMRRIATILACGALFVAGELSWLPELSDARPVCKRAGEWSTVHAAEFKRDADFDKFTALPIGYRKALYPLLSLEAKEKLWREQLQRAIDGDKLTSDQKAFLLEYLADPKWFSKEKLTKAFQDRVQELFPTGEAKLLFSRLGGPEGRPTTLAAAHLILREGVRKRFVAFAAQDPQNIGSCLCNTEYNGFFIGDCNGQFSCFANAGSVYFTCDSTSSGCGWFWYDPCDGRCCIDVGSCL